MTLKRDIKTLLVVLVLLLATETLSAQQIVPEAGIHYPVANFHDTHWGGLSLGARYQFKDKRRLALSTGAGFHYFIGREEKNSSSTFKYRGYYLFHINGGVLYKVTSNVIASLSAGPGLTFYYGNNNVAVIAVSSVKYRIDQLEVGPMLTMIKDVGTNTLWAPGITCAIRLKK